MNKMKKQEQKLNEYLMELRAGNIALIQSLPIPDDDIKRLIVLNWLEELFDDESESKCPYLS